MNTRTQIASMRYPRSNFLLPDRIRPERLRTARRKGISGRNLVAIIQASVYNRGYSNVAVFQPFLKSIRHLRKENSTDSILADGQRFCGDAERSAGHGAKTIG